MDKFHVVAKKEVAHIGALSGVCKKDTPTARDETRKRSPSGQTNPWSFVSLSNSDGPKRRRRRPTVQTGSDNLEV